MKISEEGLCAKASECMPTRYNPTYRKISRKDMQSAYITKHDCFMSGGRVYAKLNKCIMDVVTGTLFGLTGHCLAHEADLVIDMRDVVTDKSKIEQFVLGKY